jgi:hypothetical protein
MDRTWLFVRRSPSLRSWSASSRECALFVVRLVCRSSLRKQRVEEERRLHAQFPKDLGDRKEHAEMVSVVLFHFYGFLLLVAEAASHDC